MIYNPRDLYEHLGPHVVAHGVQLWKSGSVMALSRSANGKLYGMVREQRGRPYRVMAEVMPAVTGETMITGLCSCRQRSGCAHIAALLWDGLEPEDRREITGSRAGRGGPSSDPGVPATMRTWSGQDGSLPGRPTAEEDRALRAWVDGLARLTNEGADTAPGSDRRLDGRETPASPRNLLVYLLDLKKDAGATQRSRSLLGVKPVLLPVQKRGGYGRPKSLHWDYMSRASIPGYIQPIDDVLLPMIAACSTSSYYDPSFLSFAKLHPSRAGLVLEKLLETGRCHWQTHETPPLTRGTPRAARLVWRMDERGDQWPDLDIEDGSSVDVLPVEPPWYVSLSDGTCGPLRTSAPAEVASAFLRGPKLPPEYTARLDGLVRERIVGLDLPSPRLVTVEVATGESRPVPRLLLMGRPLADPPPVSSRAGATRAVGPPGVIPVVRLFYSYGDLSVDASTKGEFVSAISGETLRRIRRNPFAEAKILTKLEALDLVMLDALHTPLTPGEEPGDFVSLAGDPFEHMLDLVQNEAPKLRARGWTVDVDASFPCRLVEENADWYAALSEEQGQEWFALELGVEVEGARVNLLPVLLEYLRRGSTLLADLSRAENCLIPMPDGRLLPLPGERVRTMLATLAALYDEGALDHGRLPVSAIQAPALAALEDSAALAGARWEGGESLRRLGRRLRDFKGIAAVTPPRGLLAELRPYQREGLSWLQFLREHDLAGILADDMGLGKTVQALAHLLVEKESGRLDRPSLIVAPTSLMVNWRREAERFAPGLRLVTLHGVGRKQLFAEAEGADLVLTTYPLLWRDQDALLSREYHLLVLDEAQFIKNHKSKAARIAQKVRARHRICLTGTPLENRLMELWSLFNVLMPGLLGDAVRFKRAFVTPIEKRADGERRQQLSARVRPFLLRRTKENVATELPRKTEVLQAIEIEGAQRDLYEVIRLAMHEKVRQEIGKKGLQRSRIVILDALLKLRQVCCDPRLLKLPQARTVRVSAKFDALLELLEEMLAEGRRVLLFSQFTSMLALIEAELVQREIRFAKLVGETRDRATPVDRFQAGKVPLFLISLRAGGTGLNLTAADTVVLYDPWWNPAVEDQAIDRAHRIGQDKPVFVYKLIVAGSVEEKILALQARKRELVRGVLGGAEQESLPLTADDLDALFQPLP